VDAVLWIVLIVLVVGGAVWYSQNRKARAAGELDDAAAEARRWTERLGGQVYSIDPKDDAAARQALADAAERFTAAGSQVESAKTVQQYRLAQQTAYEGLYYVSAARTSLGLDPGPALPAIPGQAQAGQVTEDRRVEVEGHEYEASPEPGDRTRHYYPGGMVAGRPVPRGWYSEPWWKPALVAGAWGIGSALLFSAMFSGMAGSAYADGYSDAMAADMGAGGDGSGDAGGDAGGDFGGDGGGDFGGDFGGGGDFFGGGDGGGGFDF
jgi:hypothetical protein